LIADGFPQSTDRFFAQLLYRAKGESSETRTHLRVARGRDYITEPELTALCDRYKRDRKDVDRFDPAFGKGEPEASRQLNWSNA